MGKINEAKQKLKSEKVSFFTDFKNFITKGNVLDLAVAVVMGTAFNAIVNGLVKNIITPVLTYFTSGASINEWKYVLREGVAATETTEEVAEIAISYGLWIQSIIDFFIIALCIFIMVRVIKSMERRFNAKAIAAAEEAAAKKKAEDDAKVAELKAIEDKKAAAIEEFYNNVKEQSALLREIRDSVKK